MDKRVAVVSTSINAQPRAYAKWAKQGDLIVAGDINTPPELRDYLSKIGGLYIPPEKQTQTPGHEHIGWKCIQRRNAALWWALTATAPTYDYIALVDDDNTPVNTWAEQAIKNLESEVINVITSRSGFLNTGKLCVPQFTQRGTPRGVDASPYVIPLDRSHVHPVVHQSQVLGDPDCDAIQRITEPVRCQAVITEGVVMPGVYAAFNSQATLWTRDFAPVAAMFPGVGRYDDILASWIFHRLAREYNVALFVGHPTVHQDRNPHDYTKDLRAELWGMDRAFDIIATLRSAHISSDVPLVQSYGELITALSPMLPFDAIAFAIEWYRAWRDKL